MAAPSAPSAGTDEIPRDGSREDAENNTSLAMSSSDVQLSSRPQETSIPPLSTSVQPPPNTILIYPTEPIPQSTTTPQAPEPAHLAPSSEHTAPSSIGQQPTQQSQHPKLQPQETEAIGPSTDNPTVVKTETSGGPAITMTLLLTSGARHPYRIDEKYLRKRNVSVEGMDPFNISVYTLKELILRDWREEWELRPLSPSSIRLIHFGRLLDDNTPLKDCRFNASTPNVVHMTVKPQDIVDEEEANAKSGKGSRGDRGDGEDTPGCRCVIL